MSQDSGKHNYFDEGGVAIVGYLYVIAALAFIGYLLIWG